MATANSRMLSIRTLTPDAALLPAVVKGLLGDGIGVRFVAMGTSMQPAIRDGDLLWVVPANDRPIRIGDVAVFLAAPTRLVVHRVVRRQGAGGGVQLGLQGDSQHGASLAWVPAGQVVGRVAGVERNGRPRGPWQWRGRIHCLIGAVRPVWRRLRQRQAG